MERVPEYNTEVKTFAKEEENMVMSDWPVRTQHENQQEKEKKKKKTLSSYSLPIRKSLLRLHTRCLLLALLIPLSVIHTPVFLGIVHIRPRSSDGGSSRDGSNDGRGADEALHVVVVCVDRLWRRRRGRVRRDEDALEVQVAD